MELTTIQTDTETLEKLREISKVYERSMAGQLRWLIAEAWLKLKSEQLLQPETPISDVVRK